ncbi:MAG: tagaturonate epimerase family protein [Melioribacteraceae bacterium]|nr:tagaturonate epimerase family protein [Melioribacteraceae bacterium]
MNIEELISFSKNNLSNQLIDLIIDENNFKVYSKSIINKEETTFSIIKDNLEKFLLIVSQFENQLTNKFDGEKIDNSKSLLIKICKLTNNNRKALQTIFDFTNPTTIGKNDSFGFGDRIGLANAGHIRSLEKSIFKPILAQQSIRELTRTNRTAEEVMDAAVWAVFQEGYKNGFGADADHLKTTADIDLTFNAGFTMFTFDPGEHVDNNADHYDENKLLSVVANLPWKELNDTFPSAERRYLKKNFLISEYLTLQVNETEFLKAYAKYGKAIAHIKKLYEHLKNISNGKPFEVEVSVDETESVTSIFEHFFFANELKRLNVEFVSLAPRFVGSFEKGIDYKGDLKLFENEYRKHLAVTNYFGNYKISLHSGSDKFSVYKVIGSIKGANTHVKTAGTSYLEALKVVAAKNPSLFREIYDFSYGLYETEKNSYHVSADISKLKKENEISDEELLELFSSNDARQVLHVTFGKVLTEKNLNEFLFKEKIIDCLKENEETHYEFLYNHFRKHLEPFE